MVGPSQPLDLPLVSYSLLPSHLHTPQTTDNPQFIQFGYNPPHQQEHSQQAIQSTRYLRWVQPLEKELSKQVEYDMDQQDKVWLDSFNTDRKKEAIQPISYEVFEVIMDKIEKEWFDLVKTLSLSLPLLNATHFNWSIENEWMSRQRVYQRNLMHYLQRMTSVQFVTMENVKIQTQSSFAMDVI